MRGGSEVRVNVTRWTFTYPPYDPWALLSPEFRAGTRNTTSGPVQLSISQWLYPPCVMSNRDRGGRSTRETRSAVQKRPKSPGNQDDSPVRTTESSEIQGSDGDERAKSRKPSSRCVARKTMPLVTSLGCLWLTRRRFGQCVQVWECCSQ